jgi:hypothetical protein
MGEVAGQAHRDVAIYRAWVDGTSERELGERYGITQQAISKAIGRVLAEMPEPDKRVENRRAVDLCDDLLAVYVPGARDKKPAHSREARGWLQLKAKWLGIDRREVHVEHTGLIGHEHRPAPRTTAEVLAEILTAQGKPVPPALTATLTRVQDGET